ncbi:hypothetical protein JZ751_029505 [Albula glossodonta]|uniref:Nuclear envelope integral membrane protein 2 n=1 Tax=Albula glossodonta TaxID=121402 RepID=A0A8T2PDC1_9TELE|nr:hypothetical protein JZ751_029505 [Albula glossodonta]
MQPLEECFQKYLFLYLFSATMPMRVTVIRMQVRVTGDDGVRLVYPMEAGSCLEPDNFITLSRCIYDHYWASSSTGEKSLDIPLVAQDVCFMVKSKRASVQYTLQVAGKKLNRVHFGLFISGAILFYFAGAVCRSPPFYYGAGVSLGMISIPVFILFLLKNFIPKRGLFLLFGVSSSLSYMGLRHLLAHWDEVLALYWRELLGYLLMSCLISFAICYKRGPITDEKSLVLLTWTVQIVAMGMMYYGITYPVASYTLLASLLGLKCLPYFWKVLLATCRLTGRLFRGGQGLFRRRPQVQLLTEEEYREQGETYTKASLEALREHCTSAGFPAWDTVLRLRSPQRFADFLRGGSHLGPGESQTHEQQYGLGGTYFEDMIFSGNRGGAASVGGAFQHGSWGDVSQEELEYYEPALPAPSPPPTPLPSPAPVRTPALPSSDSVSLPPMYGLPMCPYPALTYTPHPEASMPEDLELF